MMTNRMIHNPGPLLGLPYGGSSILFRKERRDCWGRRAPRDTNVFFLFRIFAKLVHPLRLQPTDFTPVLVQQALEFATLGRLLKLVLAGRLLERYEGRAFRTFGLQQLIDLRLQNMLQIFNTSHLRAHLTRPRLSRHPI